MRKLDPEKLIEERGLKKEDFFKYLQTHTIKELRQYYNLTRNQYNCINSYFGGYTTSPEKRKQICKENGAQSIKSKGKIKQICYKKTHNEWLEDVQKRISVEEFREYYKEHNQKETREHFRISKSMMRKLINAYNCQDISVAHEHNSAKWVKNRRSGEEYRQYYQENFGVDSIGQLPEVKKKIRETVNLHKNENPNYYKEIADKTKQAIFDRFQTYENYLDFRNKKTQQTLIDNYGSLNEANRIRYEHTSATKELKYGDAYYNNRPKAEQTMLEKFGKKHYTQTQEYIEKAIKTNQEKYNVDFACQLPQCRISGSNKSGPNLLFANLLDHYNIEYSTEFAIDKKSFDFKINNILIEINPTSTHNSTYTPFKRKELLDKNYHYEKTKLATDNGYRCINIWDWDDKEKIVQSLLYKETIYARKCKIKEISVQEASKFINKYHFQNYCKDNIRLGLFYDNELILVMTFGKPRYNKNYEYELLRYCASKNVIGGAEKVFKYFIKLYNPDSVISYCDLSKFKGNVYYKLGFEFKANHIGKHWYRPKTNQHITDNLLRQRGYDQLFSTNYGKGSSNEELMLANGFVEIYDAGQSTFIWKKK